MLEDGRRQVFETRADSLVLQASYLVVRGGTYYVACKQIRALQFENEAEVPARVKFARQEPEDYLLLRRRQRQLAREAAGKKVTVTYCCAVFHLSHFKMRKFEYNFSEPYNAAVRQISSNSSFKEQEQLRARTVNDRHLITHSLLETSLAYAMLHPQDAKPDAARTLEILMNHFTVFNEIKI